jgi:hypothetical protein
MMLPLSCKHAAGLQAHQFLLLLSAPADVAPAQKLVTAVRQAATRKQQDDAGGLSKLLQLRRLLVLAACRVWPVEFSPAQPA